ncbi:hypothetical protein NP493_1816g00000 [Ridgeia piscesae]|uniref:LamG domain-containing protein n=1 Tax=Ridgeia piscesae TaxID=27915 RepID=A0AAD9N7S9_RIDPI|nr:hypothetical protein NP493_1816g00000 [Ridgeia piscesae]
MYIVPAEKRLITHLSFDGATGVQGSNGIWVANNRVTVVSGPQCKHGNCAHFNNTVLEIPYFVNNYDHFKQFSISYFYNLCGGPFNQGLVINNMCGTNPTDKCSIYLSSPAPDMLKAHLKSSGHVLAEASYMTANDCSWHHVVMSWDGKSMRVYVDAHLRANKPFTGPIANTKCPMIIGNMICPSGSCHFEGLMDEISFYKSALTLKEVKTIKKFPGTTY